MFEAGEEETAAADAESRNTTLTAFFQLNLQHDNSEFSPRNLLYQDIPLHFILSPEKEWVTITT